MSEALPPAVLNDQAQKAYREGQFSLAADLFEQAAHALDAQGQALDAAEMWNNVSVASLQAGDAARALRSAEGSDAVFAAQQDSRRQGLALGNQAAALEALGQTDEALARYQRSSDALKQAGQPELRAVVLKSLSALQMRTGKRMEAMASMQIALENQKHLSLRERLLKSLLKVPFRMLKS